MIGDDVFAGRDLLSIADFSPAEIARVLDVALEQKKAWADGDRSTPLAGKAVAVVLQKPSMRTRISFEIACSRLGAHPVMMTGPDGAFSRNESVYDTAKVMERYVDAIVLRTYSQTLIEDLAQAASVPVINALTDDHHPCQGLADLLTMREKFGDLAGLRFVYVGDGNNMAHTYLLGCASMGMDVVVATPPGFEPDPAVVLQAQLIAEKTGGSVATSHDPDAAVVGAHVVTTDTWASMGQEDEHDERLSAFSACTVDEDMMSKADSSAVFMHCLPAHRGEEVTDDVIDGAHSVVFDEAENRLHAQKALLSLVVA